MITRCLAVALTLALTTLPLSAAETVASWPFGTEETARLEPFGAVHRDQPGPRPPEFPDFDPANTAVKLDGKGSHFRYADPGDNSRFDFGDGDTITLEAWVNLPEINAGENLYVIGKGRTFEKGFPKDNQNWALRVREVGGSVRVSFLFFSALADKRPGDWHRWTSTDGFKAGSGWHHVAASYAFGKPESVRGWLDGKSVKGDWDMGGATTRPPVVDNDAVWIGSSQGGAASNSFRGLLDEITVHRGAVPDETLRARYRRSAVSPPKTTETLSPPPRPVPGKVTVTFHEGLEGHDRWPADTNLTTAPVSTWETNLFLIPRMPARFDDWGIRTAWKPTILMRAAAEINLPAGRHRILVRSRGGARLWLDGQIVARAAFHAPGSDGHGKVPSPTALPASGARPLAYGDHEATADIDVKAGPHALILEVLVGGAKFRPETGECCVAVRLAGDDQFRVLGVGADPIALTDAGWETASARQEVALTTLDDAKRRAAASPQSEYWEKRHAHSRAWAASHPAPVPPEGVKLWPVLNPIDQFLAARAEQAVAAGKGSAAAEFHEKVLPILQQSCFRCHGEKERGGLRLNSREAALKAGDSKSAAVAPGSPEKSEMLRRVSLKSDGRMPPNGDGLKPEQIALLERWIKDGASWPAPPVRAEEVTPSPLTSDTAFLRRVFLDTVGIGPTPDEARAFLSDSSADKRSKLIDKLLADPRGADHWISYWQDVLAENPNLVKPTLNNSGPFRGFLYDALRDGRPMDRFVTDLVMMRGSQTDGGSSGFAMAADNDAPLAAKAHILGTAFLGVEMQCARCHDSPFHSTKQRDLFSLAAMLDRKALALPKSSTVPAAFFEKKARESLIKATLKPGAKLDPVWPFADIAPEEVADNLLREPKDSRERLAVTITRPENSRFAPVMVNRVWKRLMGAGIVEPAHDWEGRNASHPELLRWLAHELVAHDYDLKHVMRLVMTSHAYQREPGGNNLTAVAERRFFASPERRRLSAEQVVDGLFAAAGKPMRVEELTFDADGRQTADRFLNLGRPRRSWQLASLANERDRPSLSLPRAQAVIDVLEAFGWNGSRQSPLTDRTTDPNVLQPGVLANGTMSVWVGRLSDDSDLTEEAIKARSPSELADVLTLRFLGRMPSAEERDRLVKWLTPDFDSRLADPMPERIPPTYRRPPVSWTNHLSEEANRLMLDYGTACRDGEPPTARLRPTWRERMEDAVWSVINLPEFVWVP